MRTGATNATSLTSSSWDHASRQRQLVDGLQEVLCSVVEEISDVAPPLKRYILGGKKLRGHLTLLPGVLDRETDDEKIVRYAAAIELIHAGTLCHDDVVDRCAFRRGAPSLNAIAGNHAAALAGMCLMWKAHELIAGEPQIVREHVAQAAARVAKGQLQEMADLWIPVTIDEYLDRQRDKTGTLFELAARFGARAAGFDETLTEQLVEFGGHLGLSFQIADDIRDLVGPNDLGRRPGVDLQTGVYTLPTLLALSEDIEREKLLRAALIELRRHQRTEDVERCRRILTAGNGLATSYEIFEQLFRRALAALEATESADLRKLLYAHADHVNHLVERSPGNPAKGLLPA